MLVRCAAVVLMVAMGSFGQTPTTLNLGTQGRNADFSNFSFTRPAAMGAAAPATCQVGQLFFNVAAPAGENLFACAQQDTWIALGATPQATSTTLGGVMIPDSSGLLLSSGSLSVSYGKTANSALQGNALGQANGVASLDPTGNVPVSQLKNLGSAAFLASGAFDASGAAAAAVARIPSSGSTTTAPALITPADWSSFAGKQAPLGFTPENSANKAKAGGYASLGSNGQVPAVQLPAIPTKTSQLTNDAGYVNATQAALAAPVQTVDGQAGAVVTNYNTIENNGNALTARGALNFKPGANVSFTFTDNGGNNSTDLAINAVANPAFNVLTGGTNTGAAMLCGTGCSFGPAASGTVTANAYSGTIGFSNGGTNATTAAAALSNLGGQPAGNYLVDSSVNGLVFRNALNTTRAASSADVRLLLPAFTGDTSTAAGSSVTTTSKVNGTSVPSNSASDQTLVTTAAATGSWASIPACPDNGGNHLNYNASTHSFSCGNTGGTGGSGTVSSSTQGYRAVYSATGSAVAGSAPSLDCSQFPGSDMSVQIQNCLVALNSLNSQGGVADARNFSTAQTWSVNPFGGSSLPTSGTLLLPAINISENLPLLIPSYWSVAGVASNGVWNQRGTSIRPSGSFHAWANPDAGTISAVTANSTSGATVTGAGTSFVPSMVGCELIAGPMITTGAGNTVAGIIASVASTTSLTLGYNVPGTPFTGHADGYAIQCPLVTMGAGAEVSGTNAYQFGISIRNLDVDCNNVTGCIGIANWFAEELSELDHVQFHGYTNIGLDIETSYAQNSGPYRNLKMQSGTSCTGSTLGLVERVNGGSVREISDVTHTTPGCNGNEAIAWDIETPQQSIRDIHFESSLVGINLGGTGGAAIPCPIACGAGYQAANGAMIDDVTGATNTGNTPSLVQIGSGQYGITLRDLDKQSNWTNVLNDRSNSCAITDSRLGLYALDINGNTKYSTAVSGCPAAAVTSVNGTAVPVNNTSDQTLVTTAAATGAWASLPACLDSGGNHLNYNAATHSFACGTTGGTAGSATFGTLTSGTNTQASMTIGNGASLAPTGAGTITANLYSGALSTLPSYNIGTKGTNRTLASKLGDAMSLLDFSGIDPTFTTDSTLGIQNAMNAACAAGAILQVPPGTYMLTPTMGAPALTLCTNLKIQGSPNAVFKVRNNADAYSQLIKCQTCSNIRVEGMTFDDNISNNTIPSISVMSITPTAGGSGYSSQPTLAISGCSGFAASATLSGGAISGFTMTKVGSCTGGGNPSATVTITGGGGSGATATANLDYSMSNTYAYGRLQFQLFGCINCLFDHNIFQNSSAKNAIDIDPGENDIISDNIFNNMGGRPESRRARYVNGLREGTRSRCVEQRLPNGHGYLGHLQ